MKKIVDFIGSIKFAAVILLLIIICAVIGSFIPQGDAAFVVTRISSLFGKESGDVHDILDSFGLLNIYSSPFFIALLFLFGLSLVICTLRLIPFARKGFDGFGSVRLTETIETPLTEAEIAGRLAKAGWKGAKEGDVYRSVKHQTGRYGVIVLHTGILVIMLGALAGYLWGFNGFMNILEGSSDNVAMLPSGKERPLGFDVRCDNFTVEYYKGTKRPKAYISKLTIINKGEAVQTAEIDVNHPLKYKGYVFYQTSFGYYANREARPVFTIETSEGTRRMREPFDRAFKITGNLIGKITDFAPALARDEEGNIFSSSDEMLNPAILIEVYDIDEPVFRGWILKHKPESGDFSELGFKIKFEDLWGVQYTGLSVKKDPGTPLVYLGFVLVFFGIVFIYLLNYTAVFFRVEEKDGKRLIRYAVKHQRRHPLVKPADGFPRLFK